MDGQAGMNKIRVIIRWSTEGKWHMYAPPGKPGDFIQEFYPCRNFKKTFKGANTKEDTLFEVTVNKIKQEKKDE